MDHQGEHKYRQLDLLSGLLRSESNDLERKAPIPSLYHRHRAEDQVYFLDDPLVYL